MDLDDWLIRMHVKQHSLYCNICYPGRPLTSLPPGTHGQAKKSIKVLNQNGEEVMRIAVNTKVDIESDAMLIVSFSLSLL